MDHRCQQFTPEKISKNMIDLIAYDENLYGKKVLENSCGEGNILKLVVERYILDCQKNGYSNSEIKLGLENDIFGAEIIDTTYTKCIDNLNKVAKKYGIININWNITNEDVLKNPFNIYFDYILGNPPYISYKNLETEVRDFIKNNYETCKLGKPDYCYAFIENALNYLNDNGKMVFLIPNSIFKNVFAKRLREKILTHLIKIHDYPNQKLFKDALTSSAIMLLQKNSNLNQFEYKNITQKNSNIIKKSLLTDKWIFKTQNSNNLFDKVFFKDFFKASITIATQRNKIFVIDMKKKISLNLENDLIKKAISPRNKVYNYKEFIIFPYIINGDNVTKFEEEDFKKNYPNIYKYLLENKEELDNRKADKSAQWFEYGRSQAIQNMGQNMLLVSTVVTNTVNVYDVSDDEIPYSGIYITTKGAYDLKVAKYILQSNEFLNYVLKIGTPASGKSVRITADDVNMFEFSMSKFIFNENK